MLDPLNKNEKSAVTMSQLFSVLLTLVLASCSTHSLSDSELQVNTASKDAGFCYKGEPIHPGCLWELQTSLADMLPSVAAVDLDGCQRNNRFVRKPVVQKGWIVWEDKDEFGTGRFRYKYLGMLNNGIHVVLTDESGGGSENFLGLLFLRIKKTRVTEQGCLRSQTLLVCVGQYAFNIEEGPTEPVRLENNTVIVGKSESLAEEFTLSLAGF